MRNWKELGEVPDSDDESLDSPESQDEQLQHDEPVDTQNVGIQTKPAPQTDNTVREAATKDIWDIPPTPDEQKIDPVQIEDRVEKSTAPDALVPITSVHDIWDLPPSPQLGVEQTAAHKPDRQLPLPTEFDGPPFSPLSSAPSDIDDIDELGILPLAPASTVSRDGKGRHNVATSVTRPPTTFEQDEISTPYVTITASLPGRPASSPKPATQAPPSTTPVSNRSGTSFLTVELPTSASRNAALDWAEAPIRGRRSLRPRKPIQQHPYLLESVQYAHVMKSHGVKPVRVLVPEVNPTRRTASGDSPDHEFEEASSPEGHTMDAADESQPMLFDDMDEDRGGVVLSPSPPRTSPTNLLHTSSQRSEEDRTDNTSVLEDDFPSVEQLVRRPPRPKSRMLKRQLSSKLLPQSKRLNRLATSSTEPASPPVSRYRPVAMFPPSSPVAGEFSLPSQDLGGTPGFSNTSHAATPASQAFPRRSPSSGPPPPVLDLTHHSEGEEASGSDSSSISRSSKSGSEVIRRNGKRIRGVLPASWLRIDQQKNPAPRQKMRQTAEGSPEPAAPRRGVATRKVSSRVSSPKPSVPTLLLFSDDSDDNEATITRPVPARRQSSPDEAPLVIWSDQEDAGSVVEEDQIDRMFVGTKRNRSALDMPSTAKRRKTSHRNPFKGQPGAKRRQPRITDVLERTGSKTSTAAKKSTEPGQRRNVSHKSSRAKPSARRAVTPPRLSVLDVLDSQAPRFLRIAARTAKRRHDLGKSSPAHKHISLGTRMDNVDALSVLRDWKSGRIRSKTTKSQTRKAPARRPLQDLSTNSSPILHRDASSVQRSNSGVDGSHLVSLGTDEDRGPAVRPSGPKKTVSAVRAHSTGAHPAQLETEEGDRPDRVGFHARKRTLDALFRHARKASSASSVRLEQQWDSIRLANEEGQRALDRPADSARENHPTPPRKNVKSRFRKRVVPKGVDLQAAHYIHANDPLPPEELTPEEPEPEERLPPDRLCGLAPYGTKYTQHFEAFPLDRGVYFHSSSLVGSGWIAKIIDPQYPERARQTRPRSFFSMDGKHLRWGPWDETASSELGILVDWIAEQFLSPQNVEGNAPRSRPQGAAAFLLTYVVDAVSFSDDDSEKSFISRSIEVVDGFLNRIEEARLSASVSASAAKPRKADLVEVLTCLTLAMHAVHRIAGPAMSLRCQVETLLCRTAKSCASTLLAGGLQDLRTLYGDLQRLSARERGIRSDCISANSWVVLMRVLENARVPRASFWDIVQVVMAGPDVASGSDVREFEKLWRDMFTLLPLCEVDDFGVVKSGMRYTTPVEGWAVPQKLLKRVFGLYTQNPRQPPSFNEYCRALAARCHYLVQEWGWRKCAGIIGTWFDFFGSQNLSHLRNEEVYKSPRFLEELGSNPSLAIDTGDRCFHIFLKVLALVIQRLKKINLTNDIKNLVARTLPNHNRQYLKEDTVHQRDLAALRNHHDLLCTLFWAAPPELRPGLHLIEKLVSPGSSHKEACLINLRAWSQLARFVVSADEGNATFRPFVSWQNNIFHQVLDQYLSAASDIQQQILALPKDRPRIGDEVVESMVRQNRSVAMDMLFVSVKASFEALKLAGSLRVATYALNICK